MQQPNHFDRQLVDPSVTELDLEQAQAGPAGAFQLVDDQDLPDETLASVRGLLAVRAATPQQAIANMRRMRDQHIPIGGVGLCLYNIRHFAWQIGALWPNANEAAAHGAPVHRFKNFAGFPRGMTVVFVNGHLGHITLSLGGGLNDTSDFHEPGYNGVATIANTAEWCGATDVFGIETVNGVDTWPDPARPVEPKPWSLEKRLKVLRAEQAKAQKAKQETRAKHFDQWADRLQKKLEAVK